MTILDLAYLNKQKATVVQGAKAAKAPDNIEGSVMQFSSLMSVMNDDFALMESMKKEYVSKKSEASVPEEVRESNFDLEVEVSNSLEVDFEAADILSNFTEREEPQKDITTGIDLISLPEPFLDPIINVYSLEEMELQPLVEDIAVEELVATPIDVLNLMPVVTDSVVRVDALEVAQIEVPDVEMAKLEIVDEVLKAIELPEKLTMEEVVVEDEVEQEDFGLKELLKREISFDEFALDDDVSLDDTELDDIPVIDRNFRAKEETQQADVDTDIVLDDGVDNQNLSLLGANAAAIASTVASAAGRPVVTSTADVNFTNVLERREKEDLPKKLQAPKQQTHFAQLLDDASDEALEKMSFNNKLLRKLELIINDPLGRMDVEISQDAGGVHVKAIVPIEVLKSMDGLEQDLQSALLQKGLELGTFEMEERGDRVNNRLGNSEVNSDIANLESEKLEEMMLGGILVNQRV